MKPYKAKLPKEDRSVAPKPGRASMAERVRKESGESLLFDIAEMVLTKVSRDGTKYYKPRYQASGKNIQEVLYGV
jgi:hypothetical protein